METSRSLLKQSMTYVLIGVIFFAVGIAFAVIVPNLFQRLATEDQELAFMFLIFRILGGVCLAIGGLILTLMAYSLFLHFRHPERLPILHFWVNLLAGLLGALSFGVPATFIYPLLLIASRTGILPSDFSMSEVALIIPLFTLIGLMVLAATSFVARSQIRARPRLEAPQDDAPSA